MRKKYHEQRHKREQTNYKTLLLTCIIDNGIVFQVYKEFLKVDQKQAKILQRNEKRHKIFTKEI